MQCAVTEHIRWYFAYREGNALLSCQQGRGVAFSFVVA